MKAMIIFWMLLVGTIAGVYGQNDCNSILQESIAAMNSGNLDMSLIKLQDAGTCDYSNRLLAQIHAQEKAIFTQIQQQKREALRQKSIAEEAQQKAIASQKEAETARALAESQKELAITAKNEADRQKLIAQAAEREAIRQEMLTVCQSMALKSKVNSDTRLKVLLALQAYHFYLRESQSGTQHNGAIFEALYQARKALRAGETNRINVGTALGRYEVAFLGSKGEFFVGSPDGFVWRCELSQRVFIDQDQAKIGTKVLEITDNSPEMRLHPTGKCIVSKPNPKTIMVYDLQQENQFPVKFSLQDTIQTISFTDDGRNLLLGAQTGTVLEWDFVANKIVNRIDFHEALKDVKSHAHDGRLYACAKSGALLYQGLGNRIERVDEMKDDAAETISFGNATGQELMAVGTRSGRIYVFRISPEANAARPVLLRILEGHVGRITSLHFSHPKNLDPQVLPIQYLASASMDETVRLWDISEQGKYELPIVLDDYQSWVWQLRFSPDNASLVAVEHNGWLRTVPIQMKTLADALCTGIEADFTEEEWRIYVSQARVRWEPTCGTSQIIPTKGK
jgi:hypothetical protein